jgi:UDP-N-acetylmuramoyl-tripeptide--D-alanyl-D-alanine ligase
MLNHYLVKILRLFAVSVIRKQKPEIIAITGSVGKSSTKEAVFAVLKDKFKHQVYATYKNLNTELGVPLSILLVKCDINRFSWIWILWVAFFRYVKYSYFSVNYPKILVLEYAADKPGDIEYLTNLARPYVACVTEIGPAHLELFKSVDNVADEKMILIKNMKSDGIAVLNKNNQYIVDRAREIDCSKRWFSGSSIDGSKNAAYEIGKIFDIKDANIKKSLRSVKKLGGRLNVLKGINNVTLIDDTYNANPLSMKMALEYLKDYKKGSRKVAILGDMRELGLSSLKEHENLATEIVKNSDFAILIGSQVSQYTAKVLDRKSFKYLKFPNFTEAKNAILDNVEKNDVVLVKASQNTLFLERVVEMLLENKQDVKYLCRQSKSWKKNKHNTL